MYSGWTSVLTLVLSLLCRQTYGFWPFTGSFTLHVHASTDAPDIIYPDSNAKRIAIIGAGAAGSSTAYYLEKFASKVGLSINITVFERNPYIGGRTTTVNAYDDPRQPVELGASIFVDVNTILKNASLEFGLQPRDYAADNAEILGIWNGKTFVYQQKDSGWYYWDIAKLLWKYGLAPMRAQRLMKTTVGKFRKLYEAPFFPFKSLSDRVFDLDLTSVTSVTGEQLLADNNIGALFATDIVQASTRVNYGQNLNVIHGLETCVCLAIDGAVQIDGGNWQIFDHMVKASNATVLLNTSVSAISRRKGKYNIKTSTQYPLGLFSANEEAYDTVVLAAPFQYSNITLERNLLKITPDEIPYVTLHVTLFTSPNTLNPLFFNITPGSEMPNTILTTLPPGEQAPPNQRHGVGPAGFFSISTLRQLVNPETLEKEYLYKVFSPKKLTSEFLSGILGASVPEDLNTLSLSHPAISWYYPHVWKSYPVEYPRITFEDPELARGFYYTSGIESFISTMETSALMGMNVAQLIVDDFQQLRQDQHIESVGGEQVIMAEMEEAVIGKDL